MATMVATLTAVITRPGVWRLRPPKERNRPVPAPAAARVAL
jgi:hypothetical protein